jgi:hypothetical protein
MSKINHESNTCNNLGRRRIPKSLASSNEANSTKDSIVTKYDMGFQHKIAICIFSIF